MMRLIGLPLAEGNGEKKVQMKFRTKQKSP
jgi:hypothetical protein